ncbi:AraC family transcriptional regulator [Microbulbifer taiwanensis]|uniref:AraC family ligand binding domain-containing protein n=1 Tax=Microbulbifer taiwanensis TaxID=986746 RepID=A0ABW1YHN7_9GAMM|nr:AraC family transcriptional regulator [Microbulbifer taiwanensis]
MPKEFSKSWKSAQHPDVELFSASFRKFSFARHWHDELAVGIVQAGAEGLDYRGQKALIPRGQIVTINPGEVHTGFAGSDSGWTYRMFYFDVSLIENILAEHSPHCGAIAPFVKGPVVDDPPLFALLQQLHLSLEDPSFALASDSLMTLAITTLFTRHGDGKVDARSGRDNHRNWQLRDYLQDNWQRNVGLDELCQLSGGSRYQLIRSFSAQFGITPHQFLILLKTREARNLLQSGLAAADVAVTCGFFDQSHLSRNFKRIFGISPGRYLRGPERNSVQEGNPVTR